MKVNWNKAVRFPFSFQNKDIEYNYHQYLAKVRKFRRRQTKGAETNKPNLMRIVKFYFLNKILEIDPHHPSLRLHQLKGKLKNLHSISINISYRITLEFYFTDKEIVLVNVGHHQASIFTIFCPLTS